MAGHGTLEQVTKALHQLMNDVGAKRTLIELGEVVITNGGAESV